MKTLTEYINESFWPFGKKKETVNPLEIKKWKNEIIKTLNDNVKGTYVIGDFVPENEFWVNNKVNSKYAHKMCFAVDSNDKKLHGYFVLDIDTWKKHMDEAKQAAEILHDNNYALPSSRWIMTSDISRKNK